MVHPERIKNTAVLTAVKLGLEAFTPPPAGYGVPTDLDGVCARRPRRSAVGAKEGLRRGRTKEGVEEIL
jgi:hypothetical protein